MSDQSSSFIEPARPKTPAEWRALWSLEPGVSFLNHGSFGACPTAILQRQQDLRARMEADAVRFFVEESEALLDAARRSLAQFVGCTWSDLALVSNATQGVNSVLRSIDWAAGDVLLTTTHAYNACRNALEFVARRTGAKVTVVDLPCPAPSEDVLFEAIMDQVTSATRLAMLDHITSPTAMILPLRRLVAALTASGIETLVDGAHAPGMVPLDLHDLGAAFYTANCHKWMCAPKGAGFLYVRPDWQSRIRPTVISHGANSQRCDRGRFLVEFDWTGTDDLSAVMCLPDVIAYLGGRMPGGWPAIMKHNHDAVLHARRRVIDDLGFEPACPEHMLGSMATLLMPASAGPGPLPGLGADPLHTALRQRHAIDTVISTAPNGGKTLRLSAMLYNDPSEYDRLIHGLRAELP